MRHYLTSKFYRSLLFGTFCLAFLCLTNAFPTTPSHATTISTSQLVAVAKDETTPTCYIKKATSQTALRIAPRQPCKAGTELGVEYIPLHQALALHQAYVLLPSQHASSVAWEQAYVQMQQLINNKTQALQNRVAPQTNCGTDQYITGYDYRYNSTVEFEVSYHVSSTCNTVTIETANMTGIHIGTNLYLYEMDYASWHRRSGPYCWPVTNNDQTFWIEVNQPVGYYFLFKMCAYYCIGQTYQYNLLLNA